MAGSRQEGRRASEVLPRSPSFLPGGLSYSPLSPRNNPITLSPSSAIAYPPSWITSVGRASERMRRPIAPSLHWLTSVRNSNFPQTLRIALAHDWLVGLRGGEWVLDRLAQLFGPTDLYTLVNNGCPLTPAIAACQVMTSFLQRLPGAASAVAGRWAGVSI